MAGPMIPLHCGGQKSSTEILIVLTKTVPTRAEDQVLQIRREAALEPA